MDSSTWTPVIFFDEIALLSIANAVGMPLKVDMANINRTKLGCASICVELDVSLVAIDEMWIEFVDEGAVGKGEGFWQKVAYNFIPSYCCTCAHMGHVQSNCKRMIEGKQSSLKVLESVEREVNAGLQCEGSMEGDVNYSHDNSLGGEVKEVERLLAQQVFGVEDEGQAKFEKKDEGLNVDLHAVVDVESFGESVMVRIANTDRGCRHDEEKLGEIVTFATDREEEQDLLVGNAGHQPICVPQYAHKELQNVTVGTKAGGEHLRESEQSFMHTGGILQQSNLQKQKGAGLVAKHGADQVEVKHMENVVVPKEDISYGHGSLDTEMELNVRAVVNTHMSVLQYKEVTDDGLLCGARQSDEKNGKLDHEQGLEVDTEEVKRQA